MIIVLILLAICTVITFCFWRFEGSDEGIISAIVCAAIMACIFAVPWGISYSTYVGSRTFYDITREQYSSAIVIYEDAAVIDMGQAAFTDLKYQGYQDNVASFIRDMRYSIAVYNRNVQSKRIMKKNPMFSWLIVSPDEDMKLIRMKTEYEAAKNGSN